MKYNSTRTYFIDSSCQKVKFINVNFTGVYFKSVSCELSNFDSASFLGITFFNNSKFQGAIFSPLLCSNYYCLSGIDELQGCSTYTIEVFKVSIRERYRQIKIEGGFKKDEYMYNNYEEYRKIYDENVGKPIKYLEDN